MIADRAKCVSVQEAARILFGASSPSEAQLRRVQDCLERGELKGACDGPRHRWTTTTGHLAEFLASRANSPHRSQSAAHQAKDAWALAQVESLSRPRHAAQLESTYQELLTDYFLAMVFRRRRRQASKLFDRAVVAGQIVGVFLVVFAFLAMFTDLTKPRAAEYNAVENWIAQQHETYRITRWFPLRDHPDEGAIVQVQYHYQNEAGRGVDTDRTFHVFGESVEFCDDGEALE